MFNLTERDHDGDAIDFSTGTALSSGDPVLLPGGLVGIVNGGDVAANDWGAAMTRGVYKCKKATTAGSAIARGDEVWYNPSTKVFGKSGTYPVGMCVEEDAADADEYVKVHLNCHAQVDHLANATAGSAAEINAVRDTMINLGLMATS